MPPYLQVGANGLSQYHNPVTGYQWRECALMNGNYEMTDKVKLIYNPGVYLVGFMQLHEGNVNDFLDDHQIKAFSPWGESEDDGGFSRNARGTDHELQIELAGRVCYMSYDKPRPGGLPKFLENLKAEAHGSVFEHAHYSFLFTGVSRNLTLELNRHRPLSISQLSGRYVDGDAVGFVVDPNIDTNDELARWARTAANSMREYKARYDANYTRLADAWSRSNTTELTIPKKAETKIIKRARERARDILPGALETRGMYTINARGVRHVLEQRCSEGAAWEIRRLFNGVYRALKKHDPMIFSDYTETPLDDGTFALTSPYRKI